MFVSSWLKRSGVLLLALTSLLLGLAACAEPPAPVPPTADASATETESDTADTAVPETETGETDTQVIKTIYVGPERVDCVGVAPQQCYLVKENPEDEYTFYYDEIEGFNFELGYEYELLIEEIEVEDPPADASSIRWVLVEEVSKTPVDGTAVVEAETTAPDEETAETGEPVSTEADATPAEEPELQLTDWVLTTYKGEPVSEVRVTIKFTSDQFSGNGGCNTYFGEYSTEGNDLSIGENIGSTMMACPDPAGSFEMAYLGTLPAVTSYQIEKGLLTLSDADGNALLVYAEDVPVSLEGTPWVVNFYNNGRGGVTSVIIDTEITALFADGQVSGNASCNTYNGSYTVDGENIAVGPLATTRMMCPEEIMQQENEFLAAMQNATTYIIQGNQMEMYDADGARMMVLNAMITSEVADAPKSDQMPPISLADVSINGIELGEQVGGEIVPRLDYDATMPPGPVGHPAHLLFTVDGEPVLRIYPIEEYAAMWETQGNSGIVDIVERLETLNAEKPLDLENNVPVLPPPVGVADVVAQTRYFDFGDGEGSGVRFVARFAQDANPLTNDQLNYYYQGLTNDGRFYVSFILPIATEAVPSSTADLTEEEMAAITADFDAYLREVTAVLNNLANDEFDPNMAILDDAMESLTLTVDGAVNFGDELSNEVEGVSGDEIQLDVTGFADTYAWEILGPFMPDPNIPPYLNGLPRHALISFDGETVEPQRFFPLERQLRLIPVEAYKALYTGERRAALDESIAQLESVLADQPAETSIPVLPDVGASPVLQSNISYVTMNGGSGVRYLTAFKQDVSPVTAGELVYMFIGLSDNGNFLIVFTAPVNTAVLPEASAVTAEEMEALTQDYDTYTTELAAQLAEADDFAPALETLDSVMSSLEITP